MPTAQPTNPDPSLPDMQGLPKIQGVGFAHVPNLKSCHTDTPGRLTTKGVWVKPSSKSATEALPVLTTTDQSRRRGNAAVDRGMPAAVTSRSARQPSSKANAAGLCFYLRGMRPLTIGPGSFKPTGEVSRSSEENTG